MYFVSAWIIHVTRTRNQSCIPLSLSNTVTKLIIGPESVATVPRYIYIYIYFEFAKVPKYYCHNFTILLAMEHVKSA